MFAILVRIAGLAATDIPGAMRRFRWLVAAYALVAILIGVALAFALVALYQHLATFYDGVTAGLAIAGGSVVLALGIVAVMQVSAYLRRRRQRRLSAQRALQAAALLSQVSLVARRKPLLTAMIVGGLAFMAFRGRSDD